MNLVHYLHISAKELKEDLGISLMLGLKTSKKTKGVSRVVHDTFGVTGGGTTARCDSTKVQKSYRSSKHRSRLPKFPDQKIQMITIVDHW